MQQNCPSMILGMSALARCAVTTCKRSTMSKLTTLGCIWHRDTTPRTTQHSRPNAACTCHQVHHHAGHPQPMRTIPVLQLPDKNHAHQTALAISGIQQGMPTTNNVFSAQRASTCCTACGMLHCTGMAHQGHTSAICQCPLHGTDNLIESLTKLYKNSLVLLPLQQLLRLRLHHLQLCLQRKNLRALLCRSLLLCQQLLLLCRTLLLLC